MNISRSNKNLYWFVKLFDSSLIIERTTATGGATEAQETKNWNIRGCQQQRYWRNNNYYKISSKSHLILFNNILKWPQLYSNRFLWTTKPYARAADKFYFFFAALEKSFAAFKNILELEERAKRNLEFSKWIKRKRRGSQRNLVDVSVSSICYLSHVSAKLHYKSILEIKKPEEVLVEANNNYLFLSKYLNSFSWPGPFKFAKYKTCEAQYFTVSGFT